MNCTSIFYPGLCISSISPPVYAQTADNFMPQWCCLVSSPHAFRQHRRLHATVVLCCQFPTCIQTTQTTSCHSGAVLSYQFPTCTQTTQTTWGHSGAQSQQCEDHRVQGLRLHYTCTIVTITAIMHANGS